MSKKLYVGKFLSENALIDFVRNIMISRENIQTIIHSDGYFYLYYWRVI